jgi:hypothetical protein
MILKEFLTVVSLGVWLMCLVLVLKQREVIFAGQSLGTAARILMVLVLISLAGVALGWLGLIGRFLLLPPLMFLDTLFGTSFW